MLSIRQVIKQDNSALLKWANDIETRNSSFNRSLISKHQHKKWFIEMFKQRSRDPVLICLKNRRARVGVVRFTRLFQKKNIWEIHFTVAPRYRGQGFANSMLSKALKWFRQKKPSQVVYALVKTGNFKSLKVLKSVGFIKDKKVKKPRAFVYLRLPSRNKKILI